MISRCLSVSLSPIFSFISFSCSHLIPFSLFEKSHPTITLLGRKSIRQVHIKVNRISPIQYSLSVVNENKIAEITEGVFSKVLLHDVISLREEFLIFEQRIGIVSMTFAVSKLSFLCVMLVRRYQQHLNE
jgi:hypothetical protein